MWKITHIWSLRKKLQIVRSISNFLKDSKFYVDAEDVIFAGVREINFELMIKKPKEYEEFDKEKPIITNRKLSEIWNLVHGVNKFEDLENRMSSEEKINFEIIFKHKLKTAKKIRIQSNSDPSLFKSI